MKTNETPKGVKFSFFLLSCPLLLTTGYLAALSPMVWAGNTIVDPVRFAYLARSCVRILALNISFIVFFHGII